MAQVAIKVGVRTDARTEPTVVNENNVFFGNTYRMQVVNMLWLIVAVAPDMYRISSAVQPSCVQVIIFSDDVDILGLPFWAAAGSPAAGGREHCSAVCKIWKRDVYVHTCR